MMQFRNKNLFFLVLSLLFFGCGDKVEHIHFNIRLEPISSAYLADINTTSVDVIQRLENSLNHQHKYVNGIKEGVLVDNNIYNFLMHITMLLDKDILPISNVGVPAKLFTCNNELYWTTDFDWIPSYDKGNGTYVFEGYITANNIASLYMLDKATDLCLKVETSDLISDMFGNLKGYEYTSNVVRIPAQEVKDMLDGLGVPYDE